MSNLSTKSSVFLYGEKLRRPATAVPVSAVPAIPVRPVAVSPVPVTPVPVKAVPVKPVPATPNGIATPKGTAIAVAIKREATKKMIQVKSNTCELIMGD